VSSKIQRLIREAIEAGNGATKIASTHTSLSEIEKAAVGLKKIAGLPHDPLTYHAFQGVMKIASEKLEEAISYIKSKECVIDGLQKEAGIQGLVLDMVDVGLIGEHDVTTKTAELLGKSQQELEVIREASKMRSAGGNVYFSSEKTASEHISSEPQRGKREIFSSVFN
jgi:hypothetical protein